VKLVGSAPLLIIVVEVFDATDKVNKIDIGGV
jgi:hypothetical protein